MEAINETLLQYIWQFQKFDVANIFTDQNEKIQILNTGYLNTNAGPDFSDAKIKIADMLWAGHVELHVKASDWQRHGHTANKSYDNVILHVVWENDLALKADYGLVPTLTLKNFVNLNFLENYKTLISSQLPIPCFNSFAKISDLQKSLMIEKLLVQRLENKAEIILEILKNNKNDWEQTAYISLARAMGFGLNLTPFERLANDTPIKILQKHNKLNSIEALLFGQAGFLENASDIYSKNLAQEYKYLKAKYHLNSTLQKHEWKYMRLRPNNFPSKRIAEFALFVFNTKNVFSTLTNVNSAEELLKLFTEIDKNYYWHNHVNFTEIPQEKPSKMGIESVILLLVNVVAPLLTALGIEKQNPDLIERAIELLEKLPAENNKITRFWKSMGLNITNAAQSQGSIEWYNNLCLKKQCLSCNVANSLLA